MTDAIIVVVKSTNPFIHKSDTEMPPLNPQVLTEICVGMSMTAGDIVTVPYLIPAFSNLKIEIIRTEPEGTVVATPTTRFLVEDAE